MIIDWFEDEQELYREDPEAYMEWHHPANQVTHTCRACRTSFQDHRARGSVALCNSCADALERGDDVVIQETP